MFEHFVYKEKNPQKFSLLWERLADECRASPLYLPRFVAYMLEISQSRGYLVGDRSFIYAPGGEPRGGVLLPLERVGESVSFTSDTRYIPAPLLKDEHATPYIFAEIDRLAREAGVTKVMFQIDPTERRPYNYLQEFGYLDTSLLSYEYDLGRGGKLLAQCRRNHQRSLKHILGDPRFTVVRVDAAAPDRAHHDTYELLHEKCSGRKTRSHRTFDMQYEQLLAGEATLFAALFEGAPAAYGYYLEAHGKVFYASTSDEPDLTGFPLNHLLTYVGMEYYREKGIGNMIPGEPSAPSRQFDYFPDKKQRGIALFKSGFPGRYIPLWRGIKYYDPRAVGQDADAFGVHYPKAHSLWNA